MKKCSFCAREVQDNVLVCPYCGGELSLPPFSAHPAYPQPPAYNPYPPPYTPGYPQPRYMPGYALPMQPMYYAAIDPTLFPVVQQYLANRYEVLQNAGTSVFLRAKSDEISFWWFLPSLFFGVIGIIAFFIFYAISKQNAVGTVQVFIGMDGTIQEFGYTLRMALHDRLTARVRRSRWLGVAFGLVGALFLVIGTGMMITGPSDPATTTESENMTSALIVGSFCGLLPAALACFLWWRAQQAAVQRAMLDDPYLKQKRATF